MVAACLGHSHAAYPRPMRLAVIAGLACLTIAACADSGEGAPPCDDSSHTAASSGAFVEPATCSESVCHSKEDMFRMPRDVRAPRLP